MARYTAREVQAYVTYTQHLCRRLYEDYQIRDYHPTVWRNMRSKCYCHWPGGLPQIVMGYQNVEYWMTNGYKEYKRLRYLLGTRPIKGLEAVHQIVLHEFGHVLQRLSGPIRGREAHGRTFVARYWELIRRYPYRGPGFELQAELLPGAQSATAKASPPRMERFPGATPGQSSFEDLMRSR